MVRSEERTLTEEDNKSTFLLTNIIPQRPNLNRKVWLKFEYYCEDLCKEQNKELFIYSGGIYHSDSTLKSEGKVAVSEYCYKIVVVLDEGESLDDITKDTECIAVLMPNYDRVCAECEVYQTRVYNMEAHTGYDFMSLIADDIETALESGSTGIEETGNRSLFSVYPNPVEDRVTIDMKGYWTESINLCDSVGASYDVKGLRISDDFISIDTSNLPRGRYFLSFYSGKKVLRAEFVKE